MDAATRATLDWPAVLEAFADSAFTDMGSRAIKTLEAFDSVGDILNAYDQIDELFHLQEIGENVPIGGIEDLSELVIRAHKGEVLSGQELRQAGQTMAAMRSLAWFFVSHQEEIPNLGSIGANIIIDDIIADELEVAFEPNGELSGRTYPVLAELRSKVNGIHDAIRSALDRVLRADDMQDILQDQFVTQRNDRYVIPIKAHAKRWDIGIIHGTSGSGQTAFIEPKEVVALNNRLRIAQGELAAEELRIRARLSRTFGQTREDLLYGLQQVVIIDLAMARRSLAQRLDATRPTVSSHGAIDLQQARHPVLTLRGLDVVPNDLCLNPDAPGLLLTGPNAGGKTISLKTIGLCALLVRMGCFVPAEEGSRVDLFSTILASIGDAQTVHEDLSSFSGHLLVLQQMLSSATPGALLLLDEIASGTDPAQGAPLAQAVIETLVERGASVVVTTHFSRLKSLAALDRRFSGAAMEYADERPTYRVLPGALGESRALATAERMGVESQVVARARSLMQEGEGAFSVALDALEEKRSEAEAARRDAKHQASSLAEREASLAKREAQLKTRAKELEAQAAEAFIDRLRSAEKAISAVVADLQRNPSHKAVKAARNTLSALESLAPKTKAPPPPPKVDFTPTVGARAFIPSLGSDGEVLSIHGKNVRVRVGTLTTQVKRNALQPPKSKAPAPSKTKQKAKKKPSKRGNKRSQSLGLAVRLPSNSLDMRGMRVDEGLDQLELFLDQCLMRHHDYAFLLHGHGTGALKQAIRQWLPTSAHVAEWARATEEQGGDAFTVVALHS